MTQEIKRCEWCGNDPLYVAYHDEEWGRLVEDDRRLFEFLLLESAQAGLSWQTILRRRDGYRRAFADFDVEQVARFGYEDVVRLMQDPGVIRNRTKIETAIRNARLFIQVQQEYGSFAAYIRSFLPGGEPIVNHPATLDDLPASTPLSDRISKRMRTRGFQFFGSTTCYAFLQATGYVNDHLENCYFKYR